MSMRKWMEKFYPTPASQIPREEAIDHSIRKWEGLTKSNRKRFNIRAINWHDQHVAGSMLFSTDSPADDPDLTISWSSCALCNAFGNKQAIGNHPAINWHDQHARFCMGCPLALSRGGVPCDVLAKGETASPWAKWIGDNDPRPMIVALKRAKRMGLDKQSLRVKAMVEAQA